MKCELCESEATVHEVTVHNGVKVERHLCESCATQAGLAPHVVASAADLIKLAMEPTVRKAIKAPTCPTCGTTFDEFKNGGMLGCANCYEAFESRLMPLIERAHEGATQHVGKSPARLSDQAHLSRQRAMAALVEKRAHRVASVRRLLDDAIKAEQYERAAQLRDELRKLSDPHKA